MRDPRADGVNPLLGTWRATAARVAPWAGAGEQIDMNELKDARIVFEPHQIETGTALGCRNVYYDVTDFPADSLFQGNLPEPAEAVARSLGFRAFPVESVEVGCDAGDFSYHFLDPDTVLIGLNNVIWTLRREAPH